MIGLKQVAEELMADDDRMTQCRFSRRDLDDVVLKEPDEIQRREQFVESRSQ